MRNCKIIILFSIILLYRNAPGTIIEIPGDYPTIQQGVDASSDGDTVLVHPGTYLENIRFNGHRITMGSLFLITGDTSYISTTILDGYSGGSVITATNLPYGVSKISGFTIQHGHYFSGGGIYLANAAPEISHNIIKDNSCVYNGGGIYCDFFSDGLIENNLILDNYAGYRGGGAYFINSQPRLIENVISDNQSDENGGGLYFWESTSSNLISNVVKDNQADGDGGGIWLYNSGFMTAQNNVITDNSASYFGGGICSYFSNAVALSNSTISRNTARDGGGIYCDTSSSLNINNSIFWADSAVAQGNEMILSEYFNSVTYSDIQGGWEGEGNIGTDPMFVDPENGDFRIQEGSPCIDAGDPIWPFDPDGTIADMGAYFYDQGFVEIIDQCQTITVAGFWFDETIIRWQQFYPSLDNMSAVELFVLKYGSPGDMIVQIRTEAGEVLHSEEINQNLVPTSGWLRLDFPQTIDLVPGQPYRIYVFGELPSPSPYERYFWRGNPDSDFPGRTDVYDLYPNYDYAFITYGYGLPTGVEQRDITVLPEEYRLSQNYPNPFNAATTIKYMISTESRISLSIYNLLGQRVETLFEGVQNPGEHALIWDASGFPSGVYFARLETGGETSNIKMVLLK